MEVLIDFIYVLGNGVCQFLLTEPIYYFTGVLIIIFVASLINRFIR